VSLAHGDASDATVVDFIDVSPARSTLMSGSTSISGRSPATLGPSRWASARWAGASDVQLSRWRGFHPPSAYSRERSNGLHGRANRAIALRWRALCACIC
jgi:hypothetical protein